MKILCTKESLLTGVNKVQKAISSKNTLPILQGIKIRTDRDTLIFEATDLEIGIQCRVPTTVMEEGIMVLPFRIFSEIIRKLPNTEIRIESEENNIHLYYWESEFFINGYDPEEFPEMMNVNFSETIQLPASLFKSMIKKTIYACAVEETRPVFTGILMEAEAEKIQLISTDTHRLAFVKALIPGNTSSFKGIIPNKTMQEIYRLLDDDDILSVSYDQSKIIFKFENVQVLTRLIEGQFPSYNQVIPKSCSTKLLMEAEKFRDAVERAALLSKDNYLKTNTVKFEITNEKLSINQFSEIGKIFEQIEVQQEGEDFSISFNAKYLIDLLRAIDTENVLMEASGSFSPCVFRPEEDEDYLSLVLPLRS